MTKKSRPLTAAEIEDVKQLLQKGRNRYNNALLDLEHVWNKIGPREYARRVSVIKAALSMVKIDQDLKVWENKLYE